MTPDISLIVCTYNRAKSLQDTLRALAAQEAHEGLSLELVVVDNHSTDETRQVVMAAAQASRWPVRYLFEDRLGKSHALNHGVLEAQAPWLVFTDDDVIPEPSWAQALHDAGSAHQVDCVGGRILPLWSKQPPAWLVGQQRLLESLALLDGGPEPVMDGIHTAYRIYGANMALRKAVFDEVGLFRTDLGPMGLRPRHGEETEMLIRAHHAGKLILYTPHAVVRHKVPAERMRLGYFRRVRFYAGRAAVLRGELAPKPFPRWLVRQCGEHLLQSLWAYGTGRLERGVQQEITFWEQLGMLIEFMNHSRANGTPHA